MISSKAFATNSKQICSLILILFLSMYAFVIQVKLQKHAAFEAEIQANKYMLDGIDATGNKMVDDGHGQSEYVVVNQL